MTFLLVVALSLVTAWFVVGPLLAPREVALRAADPERTALLDQKERCLQVIKDLDLDFETGKISPDEHEHMRAQISFELSQILARLDSANVLQAAGDSLGARQEPAA